MFPYTRNAYSTSSTAVIRHDIPPGAAETAARRLFLAIECAPDHDLLALLKETIASGATLTMCDALGRDVISFAVLKNRPQAIAVLLALGGEMPEVRPDGVDLLMQASKLDFESCCRVLANTACMDIDAVDAQGRSALHHGVLAGSISAVRFLLHAGCNPNLGTRQLSAESIGEALGMHHLGEGREVTPLMIAAARTDRAMIDVLLDMGADPNQGAFPPLHIAATQHDAGMIAHLLENGATLADSVDWETNSALLTAITANAPLTCLRLLAKDYPFNAEDARDPDQVLQHAIRLGRVDAVALFLEHGAEPGEHPGGTENSLWQLVIDSHVGKLPLQLDLLDQLATQRAVRRIAVKPDIDNALYAFDTIVHAGGDLAFISSSGLFPSVVHDLQLKLLANPAGGDWPRMRQSALHAAWHYMDMLNQRQQRNAVAPPNAQAASAPAQSSPQAKNAATAQYEWLQEAATLLVTVSKDAMRQSLMLTFFREMTDNCPDDFRLDHHIQSQFSEITTLPDSITHLVAKAWYDAARDAVNWFGDQIELPESEILAQQRVLMSVARRTDPTAVEARYSATAAWIASLHDMATEGLALRAFAADPVRWLMRREQRHDFRRVEKENLAVALSVELGLPPDTSNRLADAWADVITQLGTGVRGHSPQDWWREAARAFSPFIADCLVRDHTLGLPRSLAETAEDWCVRQTGPLLGRVSIPVVVTAQIAEQEKSNGQPPHKKRRLK